MQIAKADLQLGILGGGQLGKMLLQAASPLAINIHILDPNPACSAAPYTANFAVGSFKDYDTVYQFGKDKDVLTIEIEQVNIDALFQLQKEGVVVHPNPEKVKIIQDKGLQKNFYSEHQLATSPYQLFAHKEEVLQALQQGSLQFPFVQKLRQFGYDGKGVQIIRGKSDLDKLFEAPSMIEDLVDIDKEIAIIVVQNVDGSFRCFEPVEMVFNPVANLVEYLACPADISKAVKQEANDLALATARAYNIKGVLAIEMFITRMGEVLLNEVAPRPHNSGHHTIESCYSSQYEQHLRSILDAPLGSMQQKCPAIMLNMLGEAGKTGAAMYQGLAECMSLDGVKVHIYGKKITKPYRKMGHVTIIAPTLAKAKQKADFVKKYLKVTTADEQ